MFLSTMACFYSCSPGGVKQWIKLKASARNCHSGRQAAREMAPLIAVITASLEGYQTFSILLSCQREWVPPDYWGGPCTQLSQDSRNRSSSPVHPWHCACERCGESPCFHYPLQGIIPRGLPKPAIWWFLRISLLYPRTTTGKKLVRKLLCFSHFLHWVVRAHLQIWLNALSLLAPKVLQLHKQCRLCFFLDVSQ